MTKPGSAWIKCAGHAGSIGCFVMKRLRTLNDRLLTAQLAITARTIGPPCSGHTKLATVPPPNWYAQPAASAAATVTTALIIAPRNGCGCRGLAMPCMTTPAVATRIIGCGPRRSSAVKSITNESGTVVHTLAAWRSAVSTDASIAARTRKASSEIRVGCGQPTAPSAMATPSSDAPTMAMTRGFCQRDVAATCQSKPWGTKPVRQCLCQTARSANLLPFNHLDEIAQL